MNRFILIIIVAVFVTGCEKKKLNINSSFEGRWIIDEHKTQDAIASNIGIKASDASILYSLYKKGDSLEIDLKNNKILVTSGGHSGSQKLKILHAGPYWLVIETGDNKLSHEVLFRLEGSNTEYLWMEVGKVERRCYRRNAQQAAPSNR